MSRLIDADALEEGKFHSIENWTPIESASWQRGWNDAIDAIIDNAPTVDAVEVVRCKDCKNYGTDGNRLNCIVFCCSMPKNGFCSFGERREDAE